MSAEQRMIIKESEHQLSFGGYTTVNLDLCPGATITLKQVMENPALNPEFILLVCHRRYAYYTAL